LETRSKSCYAFPHAAEISGPLGCESMIVY